MEISLIRAFISVFDWLGITLAPYDALLFIGISFVSFVVLKLNKMSKSVLKMSVRMDMHADHFDVLDETHSQSTKDSSKALENASEAKGKVDTLISILKKK